MDRQYRVAANLQPWGPADKPRGVEIGRVNKIALFRLNPHTPHDSSPRTALFLS